MSFEHTSAAIALVNLPGLWLLLRSAGGGVAPRLGSLLVWSPFILLPAGYLWDWMSDPVIRTTWGHALHADVVYMLANGQLWPEEPQMAGLRLAYPWGGHVVQAVVSAVAGSAPTTSYMITNGVWLLTAPEDRARALGEIGRDVGRPLVVLVRRVDDAGLAAWIAQRPDTRALYAGEDVAAYLVAPETP